MPISELLVLKVAPRHYFTVVLIEFFRRPIGNGLVGKGLIILEMLR